MATSLRCPFWEVSSKTGFGVNTCFRILINEILGYKKFMDLFKISERNMNSKKKDKEFLNLLVPQQVENQPNQVLIRSDIVVPASLISRFSDSGTIAITKEEKTQFIPNSSPIITSCFIDPYLLTGNKVIILFFFLYINIICSSSKSNTSIGECADKTNSNLHSEKTLSN